MWRSRQKRTITMMTVLRKMFFVILVMFAPAYVFAADLAASGIGLPPLPSASSSASASASASTSTSASASVDEAMCPVYKAKIEGDLKACNENLATCQKSGAAFEQAFRDADAAFKAACPGYIIALDTKDSARPVVSVTPTLKPASKPAPKPPAPKPSASSVEIIVVHPPAPKPPVVVAAAPCAACMSEFEARLKAATDKLHAQTIKEVCGGLDITGLTPEQISAACEVYIGSVAIKSVMPVVIPWVTPTIHTIARQEAEDAIARDHALLRIAPVAGFVFDTGVAGTNVSSELGVMLEQRFSPSSHLAFLFGGTGGATLSTTITGGQVYLWIVSGLGYIVDPEAKSSSSLSFLLGGKQQFTTKGSDPKINGVPYTAGVLWGTVPTLEFRFNVPFASWLDLGVGGFAGYALNLNTVPQGGKVSATSTHTYRLDKSEGMEYGARLTLSFKLK